MTEYKVVKDNSYNHGIGFKIIGDNDSYAYWPTKISLLEMYDGYIKITSSHILTNTGDFIDTCCLQLKITDISEIDYNFIMNIFKDLIYYHTIYTIYYGWYGNKYYLRSLGNDHIELDSCDIVDDADKITFINKTNNKITIIDKNNIHPHHVNFLIENYCVPFPDVKVAE